MGSCYILVAIFVEKAQQEYKLDPYNLFFLTQIDAK